MGHKVPFFGRVIDIESIYTVVFPDQQREIDPLKLKEYNSIKALPEVKGKYDMLVKLSPECNPNIDFLTGLKLIDRVEKGGYIPVFDQAFETTKKVTLMPAQAMDYFRQYSKKLN